MDYIMTLALATFIVTSIRYWIGTKRYQEVIPAPITHQRVIDTERLLEAYQNLHIFKQEHLALDYHCDWYLNLIENKIKEIEAELFLALRSK